MNSNAIETPELKVLILKAENALCRSLHQTRSIMSVLFDLNMWVAVQEEFFAATKYKLHASITKKQLDALAYQLYEIGQEWHGWDSNEYDRTTMRMCISVSDSIYMFLRCHSKDAASVVYTYPAYDPDKDNEEAEE